MNYDNINLKQEYDNLKKDFFDLKDDYDSLQNNSLEIEESLDDLYKKYNELVIENDKLKSEHETLKHEYSENVIIESMKDMKEKYERLLQTTISQHKYDILYEKYTKTIKYFTACAVLLDHIKKTVNKFDEYVYSTESKQHLYKILNEINLTKTILEEHLN